MDSRELISIIMSDGWVLVNIRGSHHQFRHLIKPGRIQYLYPKDLPKGQCTVFNKREVTLALIYSK
jgi:predicted RNA binding protein YcfA (HicA-like mRNA interferase family)